MTLFYHTNEVPDFYKCSVCGAKGLKLWRQYNTCADYLELMCAPCGCWNQKQEYAIDDSGYHLTSYGKTDSIEWLVPAVPCEDRHHSGQSINEPLTYWGYTSVPELGVQWWRRLPTRCAQEVGR